MINPSMFLDMFNKSMSEIQNINRRNNLMNSIPTQKNNNPYSLKFGGPVLKFLQEGILKYGGDPDKVMSTIIPETKRSSTYVNKPHIPDLKLASSTNNTMKIPEPLLTADELLKRIRATETSGHKGKTNASNVLYEKKYGGKVGFKDFKGNSHSEGGININTEGDRVSSNPSANVEDGENMYNYSILPDKKNSSYVFSKANETASMVENIMKKYSKKNTDNDFATRASMEHEIKNIENINEAINSVRDQVNKVIQAKYGKKVKEMESGGPLKFKQQDYALYSDIDYATDETGSLDIFNINNPLTLNPINSDPVNTRNLYDPLKLPHNTPLEVSDPNESPIDTASQTSSDSVLYEDPNNDTDLIGKYGKAGMFLQGLGLAGSIGQALQPAHKDRLILPDTTQSDARFNRMNANLTNAINQVLSQNNVAKQQISDSSLSDSVRSARQMQLSANTQSALSNVAAQEQSLRNQIAQTQGQYEYSKAVDEANRKDQVQIRNIQNKAASNRAKDKLFTELTQIGAEIGRADAIAQEVKNNRELANLSFKEFVKIMEIKYPNFSISPELIDQLGEEKTGDVIKFEG